MEGLLRAGGGQGPQNLTLLHSDGEHALPPPWATATQGGVSDKDTLLNQTLVRLLTILLGLSVHFLLESSFSKNPAKFNKNFPPVISDHLGYLIRFFTLPAPKGDV